MTNPISESQTPTYDSLLCFYPPCSTRQLSVSQSCTEHGQELVTTYNYYLLFYIMKIDNFAYICSTTSLSCKFTQQRWPKDVRGRDGGLSLRIAERFARLTELPPLQPFYQLTPSAIMALCLSSSLMSPVYTIW